ncbi:hypothetical protein AB0M64_08840 [Streptomyces sp. NPDC051771]|uniref:hypothetical protein n=1 Tax=Streptomyces sp. NPDC051771 TaxID=3154847 RepID=UPI00341FD74B
MRRTTAVAGLVLAATLTATGCGASPDREDEQRLTELRREYCLRLGEWQDARKAPGARTPDTPAYRKLEPAAEEAFRAVRPLREEGVQGGRTLGEETWQVIRDDDAQAERHVEQYCADAHFETLVGG